MALFLAHFSKIGSFFVKKNAQLALCKHKMGPSKGFIAQKTSESIAINNWSCRLPSRSFRTTSTLAKRSEWTERERNFTLDIYISLFPARNAIRDRTAAAHRNVDFVPFIKKTYDSVDLRAVVGAPFQLRNMRATAGSDTNKFDKSTISYCAQIKKRLFKKCFHSTKKIQKRNIFFLCTLMREMKGLKRERERKLGVTNTLVKKKLKGVADFGQNASRRRPKREGHWQTHKQMMHMSTATILVDWVSAAEWKIGVVVWILLLAPSAAY